MNSILENKDSMKIAHFESVPNSKNWEELLLKSRYKRFNITLALIYPSKRDSKEMAKKRKLN